MMYDNYMNFSSIEDVQTAFVNSEYFEWFDHKLHKVVQNLAYFDSVKFSAIAEGYERAEITLNTLKHNVHNLKTFENYVDNIDSYFEREVAIAVWAINALMDGDDERDLLYLKDLSRSAFFDQSEIMYLTERVDYMVNTMFDSVDCENISIALFSYADLELKMFD